MDYVTLYNHIFVRFTPDSELLEPGKYYITPNGYYIGQSFQYHLNPCKTFINIGLHGRVNFYKLECQPLSIFSSKSPEGFENEIYSAARQKYPYHTKITDKSRLGIRIKLPEKFRNQYLIYNEIPDVNTSNHQYSVGYSPDYSTIMVVMHHRTDRIIVTIDLLGPDNDMICILRHHIHKSENYDSDKIYPRNFFWRHYVHRDSTRSFCSPWLLEGFYTDDRNSELFSCNIRID